MLALLALSPLRRAGTCTQQTLPNVARHSRGIGHLHVGAWWPLTEMPSQGGGAAGHGVQVTPSAGGSAAAVPKCLCVRSMSLGFISLGAERQLREQERVAGTGGWRPVLVPGSRAHLGMGTVTQVASTAKAAREAARVLSNQTDPYLGSS